MKFLNKNVNAVKDSPAKGIFLLSLPLIISNVLQILFNLSDLAIAGKFSATEEAGTAALGAIGSTSTLIAAFTGFLIGMGSGVNVIVARYIGMKSQSDVQKSVHTSAIICTVLGFAVLALGEVLTYPLLLLMKTKAALFSDAAAYLRIYLLGMPALAIYNFGNGVLNADEDTRHPLYYLLTAGVLNVILNIFCIAVLNLGVIGVAVASVVAQYLSAFLAVNKLCRVKSDINLSFKKLKYDRKKGGQIIGIGLPAGLQNAIFQIANSFIQSGVNTFEEPVISGVSVATYLDYIVYDVMAAFYTGCSVFVSANFGAQRADRIKRSYFWGLFYSFSIAFVLGILLFFFGGSILSIFTNTPEVITAGTDKLKIMSFSFAISAFMDCTISASRGLGKTFFPTLFVILGSCVFRIVWMLTVFEHFKTLESIFILYPFSWIITATAEIAYFVYAFKTQTEKFTPALTAENT